jgi:DNA polymerase III gamma/tau subunit
MNQAAAAFYRTYRPQTSQEVAGRQAVAWIHLSALGQGMVRQAYLFSA